MKGTEVDVMGRVKLQVYMQAACRNNTRKKYTFRYKFTFTIQQQILTTLKTIIFLPDRQMFCIGLEIDGICEQWVNYAQPCIHAIET
jgi:hypothetical protein